jgi:hypothetical protein
MQQQLEEFRKGGLTPAQAAEIILQGVKDEQWRILVGKDAEALDRAVRKWPLNTYDLDFGELVMKVWEASSDTPRNGPVSDQGSSGSSQFSILNSATREK